MKARSVVLTGVQKPITVIGLPPKIFILGAAAVIVVFTSSIVVGHGQLGFPTGVALWIVIWIYGFKKTRADHHFSNLLLMPVGFWAGKKTRHLIAGERR